MKLLDVTAIFGLADAKIAGGCALLDAREEAGPKPPPSFILFVDIQRAGAKLEDALQDLNRPSQASGAGERPVQFDAPITGFPRNLDPREVLVRCDLKVGKTFVVFEFLVVLGLDVLDEARFGKDGIHFTFALQKVRVTDLMDPRSGSLFLFGGF